MNVIFFAPGRKIAGSLIAAGGALMLLTACNKTAPKQMTMPPAQVEVYVTKQQTIPVTFDHIGQIDASQTVDVRARVKGLLVDQGFAEGSTVTQGQFLFRIDPRPFEADVQIARANMAQAEANVRSAQRDVARTKQLAASRSVSQEDLDNALTKFETTAAGQKLAEANLVKAQLELGYTTVTASVAGKVGKAEKRPGDVVDTGENSLLCTISAQDPIYVNFHVSEREMLDYNRDIKSGKLILPADGKLQVNVTLLDKTPYNHTGAINFFDVKIDPKTGTALVRAELPNPQGLLVPGQFVKAHVNRINRPNVILVPQSAVQQGMQGSFVNVVGEDKIVEIRPVTAGQWQGDNWIIEAGLQPGERIIIGGLLKARPGSEVNVTTVTTTLDLPPPNTSTTTGVRTRSMQASIQQTSATQMAAGFGRVGRRVEDTTGTAATR